MSQDLETILKHYKQDGRRKKPPNKTWKKSHFSYFIVDLKEGRVTCLDKNLDTVAAKLEKLLPFFAKKHITSNLIEKENSIIKKCICFGAKRNLEKWERLVEIYFAIRDEPKLLRNLCAGLRIPKQMVTKLAPRLINIKM